VRGAEHANKTTHTAQICTRIGMRPVYAPSARLRAQERTDAGQNAELSSALGL